MGCEFSQAYDEAKRQTELRLFWVFNREKRVKIMQEFCDRFGISLQDYNLDGESVLDAKIHGQQVKALRDPEIRKSMFEIEPKC